MSTQNSALYAVQPYQMDKQLRTIVDASAAALLFVEPIHDDHARIIDFKPVEANQAYANLNGRSLDTLLGLPLSQHELPSYPSDLFRRLTQVVSTQETLTMDLPYPQREGVRWLMLSATCQGKGLVLTFWDSTPLQQQNHLLKQAFESSPLSMIVLEPIYANGSIPTDFRLSLANQATSLLFNWSVEYLLDGGPLSAKIPFFGQSPVYDLLVQVSQSRTPARTDALYEGDGVSRWLEVSVSPQGKHDLIATITDVTVIRQADQLGCELKRAKEQIQEFAFMVSHDLQEPLRKIQTFSKALSKQYDEQAPTQEAELVQRMQSAAVRMSTLIGDMLTYSRTTTHLEAFQPVSLSVLVSGVVKELEIAGTIQGAEISIASMPDVTGDPAQLRQLFKQLINNSLKFRRTNGTCTVQIQSRQIPKNRLPNDLEPVKPSIPADLLWEISVIDNGIGFEDKYKERIFQAFQRLHNRNQYEGSGMGLSISRKIVENHHGAITGYGKPDEGATFLVYLPVE